MPELLKTKGGITMKKITSFIVGSLVGGGIAGYIGFFAGMITPFAVVDKCDNNCICWRRIKDGKEIVNFYGNTNMFPELNKEGTSE